MHLNPILFPAPRRKYTPELLMGELIWIPKYKQPLKPSTPSIPSHKSSHSMTCGDLNKNILSLGSEHFPSKLSINNLTCKPSKLGVKSREEVHFHAHSKSAFEFHNDYENKHSTRILNQLDCFDAYENLILKPNLHATPNRQREKEDTNLLFNRYGDNNAEIHDEVLTEILHSQNQSFAQSPMIKKSGFQSEDVSFDGLDSPAKTGPVFLEKKFVKNQIAHKVSRASLVIRDDYSNFDSNQSSTNHSKKTSQQGCDLSIVGEDLEANFDIDFVEEFPAESDYSAPQTISFYTTKTNEKSYLFKRMVTEYSFQASCELQSMSKVDLGSLYKNPHQPSNANIVGHIPCLILKSGIPSNKILLYFHGNGEDVYLSYDFLAHIRNNLNVHVLGIEYPGYGIYKGDSSEENILADAESVFDYLVSELSFDPKNIMVFGRSIGSGPATWLASKKEVGFLALMSSFTSIRGVVRDFAGRFIQYFVKERFNNLENIAKVKCPTFIVHGLKDTFIPCKHSKELFGAATCRKKLILPIDMNHVEFDFYEDFTEPLMNFMREVSYKLDTFNESPIDFPLSLFGMPSKQK